MNRLRKLRKKKTTTRKTDGGAMLTLENEDIGNAIQCSFESGIFYTNHQVHESRGNILSIRLTDMSKFLAKYNRSNIQIKNINGVDNYILNISVTVTQWNYENLSQGVKRKKVKPCRLKSQSNAKVKYMWKDLSSNAIALRFLKDDAKEALISSIRNSQNTISYQLHVPCILEEEEEEECEKGEDHNNNNNKHCGIAVQNFSIYLRPCFNGNATVKVVFEHGMYEHTSNMIVRSLWKHYRQQSNIEKKRFRDNYFKNFNRQHRDGRLKKNCESGSSSSSSSGRSQGNKKVVLKTDGKINRTGKKDKLSSAFKRPKLSTQSSTNTTNIGSTTRTSEVEMKDVAIIMEFCRSVNNIL